MTDRKAREEQKAWEDEQVMRKLDSVCHDGVGRYALIRSLKAVVRPYAVLFLTPKEDPAEVVDKLKARILELSDDARTETMYRMEADRDRLNTVSEVTES